MKFDDICNSILERVFHGTPHDIVGSFDLQKIGTGEGAQAYGWGLYFAENEDIAYWYKKKLSDPENTKPDEKAISDYEGEWKKIVNEIEKRRQEEPIEYKRDLVDVSDLHDQLGELHSKMIQDTLSRRKNVSGNLYEVDILADKENDFMDWDKALSQQSEKYKNRLIELFDIKGGDDLILVGENGVKSHWSEIFDSKEKITDRLLDVAKQTMEKHYGAKFEWKPYKNIAISQSTGADLYKGLDSDPKKASNILLGIGIKGIKYLDQASREEGEGKYNYVIFDPKIIKIVAKNGEFVMKSKKPENVEI